MAANISLHPLGERASRRGRSTNRVLYAEGEEDEVDDDGVETKTQQPPRPPRIAKSRQKHRHQAADQFFTPSGAVLALLRVIGTYIIGIYTGNNI